MLPIKVRNAYVAEAQAIYELSLAVYDYDGYLLISAESIAQHIERYPQAVFVAESKQDLVGYAITLRTSRQPEQPPLPWLDAIGGLSLSGHQPDGEWLYGVDFGVHPDYRKKGIGSRLYQARFNMINRLNLRGFYAGGMLQGYKHHAHLSLQEYSRRVKSGQIIDPTVTMQMNRGFESVKVIPKYSGDSLIHDSAMLICWYNENHHISN